MFTSPHLLSYTYFHGKMLHESPGSLTFQPVPGGYFLVRPGTPTKFNTMNDNKFGKANVPSGTRKYPPGTHQHTSAQRICANCKLRLWLHGRDCQRMAAMVAAGSGDLKTALPATRISAPASARARALEGETPPSTSMMQSKPRLTISSRTSRIRL